ncbi:MAG: phosphoglycerate kinase [Candidatus Aenigmarchaeota archaeon]|nr:phosphoglycerate kinase [Candidatus Aenigmarchaeota archaeon]
MVNLSELATLNDIDEKQIRGQSVLLRTSFDAFDEQGQIKDGLRIETAEGTIRMLKQKGARRIIIMTYAGRPEKAPAKEPKLGDNARYVGVLYDKRFSLRPTADYLHGLLREKVHFIAAIDDDGEFYEDAGSYISHAAEYIEKKARNGDVVLLDNLRFWEGENNGDKEVGKEFARLIASLGTVYVQDGFAQAHRVNNATVGEITRHVKIKILGLQFKKEIEYLRSIFDNLLERDRKPFIFIIGGKKIETKPGIVSKIEVASKLMDNMQPKDSIFVGGAMAYPFLIAHEYLEYVKQGKDALVAHARGKQIKGIVGDSYLEWEQVHDQVMVAGSMLLKAESKRIEVQLPVDHGVFAIGAKKPEVFYVDKISEGMVAGDIGPKTVELWSRSLKGAHTILLAGPVGWYENELFSAGSLGIVEATAAETQQNGTVSIAAGGDTAEMVRSFGYGYKLSLVSIGGGATLEFLLHGGLPSLELLDRKETAEKTVVM